MGTPHLKWEYYFNYDLTDHLPNFLIVKKFTSLPNKVKIYKREYSNFDKSALIQDIHSVDWENVLHARANPDPYNMFNFFYTRISDIVDVHIPLVQLSKRELRMKSKPWITPALIKNSKLTFINHFTVKVQVLRHFSCIV